MSGVPIKYRVKLAFGFYQVGHVFISPPMSRGFAMQMKQRGYLEEVTDAAIAPAPEKKRKRDR